MTYFKFINSEGETHIDLKMVPSKQNVCLELEINYFYHNFDFSVISMVMKEELNNGSSWLF